MPTDLGSRSTFSCSPATTCVGTVSNLGLTRSIASTLVCDLATCSTASASGLHGVAFIAGFVTVLSFLYLAWSVGGYNVQVRRVVVADVVALVLLIVGGGLHSYTLWRG